MIRLIAAALVLTIPTGAALAADGKELFVANGCNKCHAVSMQGIEATAKSEKMRGPDLATTKARLDPAWIVRLINKQEQLDGKNHKGSFKGKPEDLEAIAAWVAGLKGQ